MFLTLTQAEAATQITFSDIKDYNYVCMNINKPTALVFKTSTPQKIWRTTLTTDGQIKTKNAFELSHINLNSEYSSLSTEKISSFKAQLEKNYEIKGLFEKDFDGDLPLTVVSTFTPEGKESQIIDHYNCETKTPFKQLQLGSANKE